MQYLLTSEEYKELTKKAAGNEDARAMGVALKMMRHALTEGRCVHTTGRDYCDECPIGKLDRTAGKEPFGRQVQSHLCDQPREYSK